MTTKIAIVGEAWGEEEERQKLPFVGPAGRELNKMLAEAGINRADCFLTNVFNLRPTPKNDIVSLCGAKKEGIPGRTAIGPGKYIRAEFAPEIERLHNELREVKPNLIIACGGVAAWAILGQAGIRRIRGTVAPSTFGKVLPIFHPAAILRDWSQRHVTVLDLMKAAREAEYPEIRRPRRQIWVDPGISDITRFYEQHMLPAKRCAVDIETAFGQITCIGFAPRPDIAIVIPFVDHRKPGNSYWATQEEEVFVWNLVRDYLHTPCEKIFQNGLYDLQWLWRLMGLTVPNAAHDTMLLHHALLPESPKALDFLGSVYTNEASWKLMRPKGKATAKKEN